MTTTTHSEMSQNKAWSGRGRLEQLVAELNRQKKSKFDFVADARTIRVNAGAAGLEMAPASVNEHQVREFISANGMPISDAAVQQIGQRVTPDVPWKFLGELAGARPTIAASLLTELMHATGRRNLVRCMDGRVRAYLSDRYRVMDNFDMAFAALDVAKAVGAKVLEASLSDTHMRLKLVDTSTWDAVDVTRAGEKGGWFAGGLGSQSYLGKVAAHTVGDLPGGPGTVHPVVTITNSETGHGGLGVRIGILHALCFNLATVEAVAVRVHLGERLDLGIMSPEAVAAENNAIMLKARDGIRAAFTDETWKRIVAKAESANEDVIAAPTAAVDAVVGAGYLTDAEKSSILEHFLGDYKPTRYGLAQAVARAAQDTDDPERATAMEELSGQLVESPALLKAALAKA